MSPVKIPRRVWIRYRHFFTIPVTSRTMEAIGPDACLERILALPVNEQWGIDTAHAIPGVTAYAVRSFDGDALCFSLPLIICRPLLSEILLDARGAAGAVAYIIERIKQKAASEPGLGPLFGRGTRFPHHYASTTEPYTLVSSPASLASDLWHAGNRNFADMAGVHLLLCGAVPCPP